MEIDRTNEQEHPENYHFENFELPKSSPDQSPVDPTLAPFEKELTSPDFTDFEIKLKIAHSQELSNTYKHKIIDLEEQLKKVAPLDIQTRRKLTYQKDAYTLQLIKIIKPWELGQEIEWDDPIEKAKHRQEIVDFRFPTNLTNPTEILETQVDAKKTGLEYQIKQLNDPAFPTEKRLVALATLKELVGEIADINKELEARKSGISTVKFEKVAPTIVNEIMATLPSPKKPKLEVIDEYSGPPAAPTVRAEGPIPDFIQDLNYQRPIRRQKSKGLKRIVETITSKFRRAA